MDDSKEDSKEETFETIEEWFKLHPIPDDGVVEPGTTASARLNVGLTGDQISLNRITCLAQYTPAYVHFMMTNKDLYNMPFSVMGDSPLFKEMVLSMFCSSISNGCEYCTCTFTGIAIRKSSDLLEKMIHDEKRTKSDVSLIKVAQALGRFPADLCTDELVEVRKYWTTEELERLIMAIANCGGDNFISQSLGVKLEWDILSQSADYLTEINWNPGRHTPEGFEMPAPKGKEIKNLQATLFPAYTLVKNYSLLSTISEEMKWKSGIPSSWPRVGKVLKEKTGYNFPLLQRMDGFRNVVACFGSILRDSFDEKLTKVGLLTKAMIQVVWATVVNDEHLQGDGLQMMPVFAKKKRADEGEGAKKINVQNLQDDLLAMAEEPSAKTKEDCEEMIERLAGVEGIDDEKTAAVLVLARAASDKPTYIDEVIIKEVLMKYLSPPEVAEVIIWIAMLITFHRVLRFYEVKDNTPEEIWEKKAPMIERNSPEDRGEKSNTNDGAKKTGFFARMLRRKNSS